jgi:hypothetical protein
MRGAKSAGALALALSLGSACASGTDAPVLCGFGAASVSDVAAAFGSGFGSTLASAFATGCALAFSPD